jgi:hypothetical protein
MDQGHTGAELRGWILVQRDNGLPVFTGEHSISMPHLYAPHRGIPAVCREGVRAAGAVVSCVLNMLKFTRGPQAQRVGNHGSRADRPGG